MKIIIYFCRKKSTKNGKAKPRQETAWRITCSKSSFDKSSRREQKKNGASSDALPSQENE